MLGAASAARQAEIHLQFFMTLQQAFLSSAELTNYFFQNHHVQGLGYMGVHAGVQRGLLILREGVGRHGDDGDAPGVLPLQGAVRRGGDGGGPSAGLYGRPHKALFCLRAAGKAGRAVERGEVVMAMPRPVPCTLLVVLFSARVKASKMVSKYSGVMP